MKIKIINKHLKQMKLFPVQKKLSEYPKERKTYPQIWPIYNEVKTNEKHLFLQLLNELLEEVFPENDRSKGVGRPRLPNKHMIFACCVREYSHYSSRKTVSELKMAKDMKMITKIPHFNSICNFLKEKELYKKLQKLIIISALPLSKVEPHISIDSSGFGVNSFDRWMDHKYGKSKSRGWVKAHLATGAKTQIICAAEVTNKNVADSPNFGVLFLGYRKYFEAKAVSADRGYISKANLEVALDNFVTPYIPFKDNAVLSDNSRKPSSAWIKMYYYFKYNEEEFLKFYHQRSKIETTFSMIKKKFGSNVKSKTFVAQQNELLCRFLVHNICVLIQEMFELGIDVNFFKANREVAQKGG